MSRELQKHQLIERSITKKFRHELWNPFVEAVKEYRLVEENDTICVILDGTAQSILCAKLLQHLKRISPIPFEIVIKGDGDYSEYGIELCNDNEQYSKAVSFECLSDVIEKTLGSVLHESRTESILPMQNGIIRPLFCIKRESVEAFVRYNALQCPVIASNDTDTSLLLKRLESENKGICHSIFRSVHSLSLDTMVSYEQDGKAHSFLDNY